MKKNCVARLSKENMSQVHDFGNFWCDLGTFWSDLGTFWSNFSDFRMQKSGFDLLLRFVAIFGEKKAFADKL